MAQRGTSLNGLIEALRGLSDGEKLLVLSSAMQASSTPLANGVVKTVIRLRPATSLAERPTKTRRSTNSARAEIAAARGLTRDRGRRPADARSTS